MSVDPILRSVYTAQQERAEVARKREEEEARITAMIEGGIEPAIKRLTQFVRAANRLGFGLRVERAGSWNEQVRVLCKNGAWAGIEYERMWGTYRCLSSVLISRASSKTLDEGLEEFAKVMSTILADVPGEAMKEEIEKEPETVSTE